MCRLFNINKIWLSLVWVLGLLVNHAQGVELFTFYTYHNKPPYTFNVQHKPSGNVQQKSLYLAYVDYLNARQNLLHIKLVFLPRLRLEYQLRNGELKGATIGVNPLWFDDKNKIDYLWSAPFMQDQDVIVVKSGGAFPYVKPHDLLGKSLALPRGAYFWGVSELIEAGKTQVFETNSERHNLEMLELGRVQATIMSILSARYFFSHEFKDSEFEILNTPHDQFARMVLFPKNLQANYIILAAIIKKSSSDPQWLAELERWR